MEIERGAMIARSCIDGRFSKQKAKGLVVIALAGSRVKMEDICKETELSGTNLYGILQNETKKIDNKSKREELSYIYAYKKEIHEMNRTILFGQHKKRLLQN